MVGSEVVAAERDQKIAGGVDREDVSIGERDRSRFEMLRARREEPDRRALPRGPVNDRVAVWREPCGTNRAAAKREGVKVQPFVAARSRAQEEGDGGGHNQSEPDSGPPPEPPPCRAKHARDGGRSGGQRFEIERDVAGGLEAGPG